MRCRAEALGLHLPLRTEGPLSMRFLLRPALAAIVLPCVGTAPPHAMLRDHGARSAAPLAAPWPSGQTLRARQLAADVLPPSTPSGLTMTGATRSTITLDWNASA